MERGVLTVRNLSVLAAGALYLRGCLRRPTKTYVASTTRRRQDRLPPHGDAQEALDVAQETFMRAFERWDPVSRMEYPAAWLHRVAATLAISYRRRLSRQLRRVHDVAPDEPAPPDAESHGRSPS